MKKFILTSLCLAAMLPALAQTDFRHITYDEAINAAKAENKMIFMDFYTDWCGPCKMMMRDVFPQKTVGDYMNKKFVCIKLNAEKEGKELADLYQIKAYPTFIIINSDKKIIGTKIGGASADKFISDIDRLIDPEKSPERLTERYKSGERTAELIKAYAAYKMSAAEESRSQEAYNKVKMETDSIINAYFNGLNDTQKVLPENIFIYTEYSNSISAPTTRFMVEHLNDFPTEIRQEIKTTIEKLYATTASQYLNAQLEYNNADYEIMKNDIKKLGLDKDKQYDACFKFIECRAKGDMNAWLDLYEKEAEKLTKNQQYYLSINFAALFKTADDVTKKRASKILRSRLENMDANQIIFAAYQISELEKQPK